MQRKRLYFDIETSFNVGWFWSTGKQFISGNQIIHEKSIICICWKWEDEEEIHFLTWDRNQSDAKMLKAFIKEINKADEIVAHNGDKFDIKWLRTRCLKHRIPMFPSYQSLDTLKMVKSSFNLSSNSLNYIAGFLGLGGKIETGGIDLWKEIVFNNNQEALDKMVDYCKNDVHLLESVYNEIKDYTKHKTHYAVLNGEEKYCCPECGSPEQRLSKTYTTSAGTINRSMKCKSCGKTHTISNVTYKEFLKSEA